MTTIDLSQPTPTQLAVYGFVRGFQLEHGFPPTLREVAEFLGAASTNAAWQMVRALVRKGVLRPARGRVGSGTCYVCAIPEVVAAAADDGALVRVSCTGPVTFSPAGWRAWLCARLAELDAADATARPGG